MDEKLFSELEHHKRFPNRGSLDFLNKQRQLWESVLLLIKKHNAGKIEGPVLEVGNGPYGFFLALEKRTDIFAIDPLNEEYPRIFPHMGKFDSVHFISKRIEDVIRDEDVPTCKTILCYNVLDHVDDTETTIENMCKLSAPDAIFLIGVDYYPNKAIKSVLHKFRKHLDPPHPHHFSFEDLMWLMEKYFIILEITDTLNFKYFTEDIKINKASLLAKTIKKPLIAAKILSFKLMRFCRVAGDVSPNMQKTAVFILKKK